METKVYFICGRPHTAVRVASCNGKTYTNYVNAKRNTK